MVGQAFKKDGTRYASTATSSPVTIPYLSAPCHDQPRRTQPNQTQTYLGLIQKFVIQKPPRLLPTKPGELPSLAEFWNGYGVSALFPRGIATTGNAQEV